MPVAPTNAELIDAIEGWKAEAYIVIGNLLHVANAFETPAGQKALDYFSSDNIFPDGSILPFYIEKEVGK